MLDEIENLLKKFSKDKLFEQFYFIGGTALSYYLNHRISYDLDFISLNKLSPSLKTITIKYDANYIPDIHSTQFRINTGEDIENYKMMFNINGIKVEFFYPNDPIRLAILEKYTPNIIFENIKIMPLEAIAKLKLLALFRRNKIRDLFDIYVLMNENILNNDIIEKFCALEKKITFVEFIENFKDDKSESLDFNKNNSYFMVSKIENKLDYLKKEIISIFIKGYK